MRFPDPGWRSATAIAAELTVLSSADASGDIYAVLAEPDA
jgi:hypothetical protein